MLKTAIILGIGFCIGKAIFGFAIAAVLFIVSLICKIMVGILDRV